jgi:hypothetical protein
MKRVVGSFLIGLSIVCFAATVLMFVLSFADRPENPTEDDRTSFVAFLLFVGVLIVLEAAMFLCGRYLRRTGPALPAEEAVQRRPVRPLPMMVYLMGSLGIGLLASFGGKILPSSKALLFLIGQPQVLTQLIFGGILGLKLGGGTVRQAVMMAANLLYFLVLFYPVYSIATMDRAVEVVRYKQMKILLGLFLGVHILMAMVIAMLIRA